MTGPSCFLLLVCAMPLPKDAVVEIALSDVHKSLVNHFGEDIQAARTKGDLVARAAEKVSVKLVGRKSAYTFESADVVVFEVKVDSPSITINTPPGKIDNAMMVVKSVCTTAEVDEKPFQEWLSTKAFALGDAAKKSFRQGSLAITIEVRNSFDEQKPWVVFVTLSKARD